MKKIRTAKTGANRNPSDGKFQYSKFVNPLNEYSFAKYMHGKRLLPDGSLRNGDNWQKGLDKEWLMDSLTRHIKELELLDLGFILVQYKDDEGEHTLVHTTTEEHLDWTYYAGFKDFTIINKEDVLNAIRFNSEALKLQLLGYRLEDTLKEE